MEDVAACKDAAGVHHHAARFAASTGYDSFFVCGIVDHLTGTDWHTIAHELPPAYSEVFKESGVDDPVIQHCKKRMTPKIWDRETFVTAGRTAMWERMEGGGLTSGYSIALHMPAGRHLLFGIARYEAHPVDAEERQSTAAAVSLFASFIAEPVRQMIGDGVVDRVPDLTAQELECLRWRGEGKSAWETGAILGISESRINQVCASALKKLGCVNTPQAAFKALRLGLIN